MLSRKYPRLGYRKLTRLLRREGWQAGRKLVQRIRRECESFHGSLRDECLDRELMLSVAEARVVIEGYRRCYNEVRPHSGTGYRTPAQAS